MSIHGVVVSWYTKNVKKKARKFLAKTETPRYNGDD
jgi:hypothetical protein